MTDRIFKKDNFIFSYTQQQCLEFGLSFCETGLDLQSTNVLLNTKKHLCEHQAENKFTIW